MKRIECKAEKFETYKWTCHLNYLEFFMKIKIFRTNKFLIAKLKKIEREENFKFTNTEIFYIFHHANRISRYISGGKRKISKSRMLKIWILKRLKHIPRARQSRYMAQTFRPLDLICSGSAPYSRSNLIIISILFVGFLIYTRQQYSRALLVDINDFFTLESILASSGFKSSNALIILIFPRATTRWNFNTHILFCIFSLNIFFHKEKLSNNFLNDHNQTK